MRIDGRAATLAVLLWGMPIEGARAQDVHVAPEGADHEEPEPVRVDGVLVPLDRLLRIASRSAPTLRVARAEVQLADEALGAADVFLPGNPSLQAQLGPRFGANGASDLDVQLTLLQSLEIGGERPLRFSVARAARRARETEVQRAGWQVHQAVHAGYRAALIARRRAELARDIAHFQEELVQIAGRRVAAGEAAPLILRLAEAELAQAQQRSIAAVQSYREACLALAGLVGWEDPARPPEPVGELEVRAAPPLTRLVELAREHNPLLEVRRAQIDEARARAALAGREVFPELSLGVQYAREGAPGGGTPQDSVLGVVAISIPMFQLNQAERAGTEARLEVALAEESAVLAVLEARLEALRTGVNAALARIQAYGEDILPRFAENLRLLRRAFELGEIDLLQLSVAIERFLGIQLEALDAYEDYFDSAASLELEIGTELEPEADR